MVAILRCQRITQSCPINKQRQFAFATNCTDFLQLCFGVGGAILGGLRNIHHARLYHVLVGCIIPMRLIRLSDFRRSQSAVRRGGQNNNLMPCRFNRTCFMHIQMSRIRAENTLIGAQNTPDYSQICLRAANQKMHINILSAARLLNQRRRTFAVGILAIACRLFHIGLHQTFQNTRMHPLRIITFKTNHFSLSF